MDDRLYNTELELGLRSLFILKGLQPSFCNLDRLLYLDYLCLYIEDFKVDALNLHPKYPFQAIESYEKRETLKKAVFNFALKGLVDIETNNGLSFGCNANTLWLIDSIDNTYSEHLSNNIQLIIEETAMKTDAELKEIIFSQKNSQSIEFDSFYPYSEED